MVPRRGPRAQTRASSRLASLSFGIGCLVVLVVTFALGVVAGRRWPSGLPLPGLGGAPAATAAARGEREAPRRPEGAPRRPEGRGFDKNKVKTITDGPPILTFYHDLTAPLTSTPPPTRAVAKPERVEAKTTETARSTPRSADAMKPVAAEAASLVEPALRETPLSAPAPPTAEARFTVQVGAFKLRSQAEALRARLADRGYEAYVTEGEIGGVTQYRVRVGSFATREAARDAAARLGTERQLATYVTTR
jgi:cell division septation protein DedD